jgi:hypothetical protein
MHTVSPHLPHDLLYRLIWFHIDDHRVGLHYRSTQLSPDATTAQWNGPSNWFTVPHQHMRVDVSPELTLSNHTSMPLYLFYRGTTTHPLHTNIAQRTPKAGRASIKIVHRALRPCKPSAHTLHNPPLYSEVAAPVAQGFSARSRRPAPWAACPRTRC